MAKRKQVKPSTFMDGKAPEVAPQVPERFASLEGLRRVLKDVEERGDSDMDRDDLLDVLKFAVECAESVQGIESLKEDHAEEIAELRADMKDADELESQLEDAWDKNRELQHEIDDLQERVKGQEDHIKDLTNRMTQ
jgi:predicted  nucleic acid-binding Zn-ribbon protein